MHSLRRGNLSIAIGSGLLALAIAPEAASAQAQALPFSQNNIPLTTGSSTFSVNVNLLTAPDRPQLRIIATPDASHPNMTLEVHIDEGDPTDQTDDGCPNVFFGGDCINTTNGDPLSWTSHSAPGP